MSSCHLPSAALFRQPVGQSRESNLSVEPVAIGAENGRGDWALLGESVAVRRLRSQISRVAPHFRTALIRGEAGSGKEFVAWAIHALSPGAEGPFIVADARLMAKSVDRGDACPQHFTSGVEGVLESAQGGTLYLTPVAELSVGQQAALLRVLRAFEGSRSEVRRFESRRTRILAGSDRDLHTLAAMGQFSQDLYTRLSGVEILVPPLRQRVDDIPALVDWLLGRSGREGGRSSKFFAESAMAWLQDHRWPNNLRELERVVRQAEARAGGRVIEVRHVLGLVEPQVAAPPMSSALEIERLHDVVQRHVLDVLTRCEGNKLRAAERLGISRSTLYRMLGATSACERLLAE